MEFNEKDLLTIYDALRVAKEVSEALGIKTELEEYKRLLKVLKNLGVTKNIVNN